MPVVLGLLWHPLTASQLARSVRHRLSSTCFRKSVWVQRLNIVRLRLLTRPAFPIACFLLVAIPLWLIRPVAYYERKRSAVV